MQDFSFEGIAFPCSTPPPPTKEEAQMRLTFFEVRFTKKHCNLEPTMAEEAEKKGYSNTFHRYSLRLA